MSPCNPDLNIQLSTQHFQLMSKRISNVPNQTADPLNPTIKSIPFVVSVSENSCSIQQNSSCLFSFSHSVSFTLRYTQDLYTGPTSFTASSLQGEGQTHKPFPDLTCEPPTCVLSGAFPFSDGQNRVQPSKSQDEDSKVISLNLRGPKPLLT